MKLLGLVVCVVAAVMSGVASASCGPVEANIDYWGNDITQTKQSSADRCCTDCAATANCVVATWRAGTCYLKHTKANRYSSDGAMSISPTPTSTCGATETDIDYYGNDIKQTKQGSANGCCADCAATANCVVYTWRDGTCYLKHTKANRYTSTGVKSASMTSSSSSQVCAPIEENIDYYGNDIKFTKQPNADACCADCAATPGCIVYTWRDYGYGDTKCWLKSAKGARGLCNGAQSASMQSSSNICRPIEENTDYPGNDIARLSRATAGECCDDCRARADCVVSVWYAGLCYLKNAKGNKVYVSGARAASVGGVTPTPAPSPSGGTLKDQILRQTNLIRKAHGYTTLVVWDDKLAADMQAWADSCPQKNGGGHGGPPGAQNLAGFDECKTNCNRQVGAAWNWYDSEQQLWSYERDACANGDWMTCGHFQNSMNKGVSAIGCGWSTCYNPNINGQDSLVWCNYIGVSDPPEIPRPNMAREAILASLTA